MSDQIDEIIDSDNDFEDADEDSDVYFYFKDGPNPPDWGECAGGWIQKEQINEKTGRLEARWCEPSGSPAEIPDWGDCPDGWEPKEEKDDEGNILAKYCEPVLPPEETECERGYFPMFGSTECQLIGEPCPEGPFAEIDTDAFTEVIYVSEGESIQNAVDAAKDGALILISKGIFNEPVSVSGKDLTISGACIQETILTIDEPYSGWEATVLKIEFGTTSIQNLTITSGLKKSGISVDGEAYLKNILIEKTNQGIYAMIGSKTTGENIYIKNIVESDDPLQGIGIYIYQAEVSLKRTVIEKIRYVAVFTDRFSEGAKNSFDAADLYIKDTVPREIDNSGGIGMLFQGNNTIKLKRTLIEGSKSSGMIGLIKLESEEISLLASEFIIRNTLPDQSNGTAGEGLVLQDNVDAIIKNALIDSNSSTGISVSTRKPATRASFKAFDTIVIKNNAVHKMNGKYGGGIVIMNNVLAELERVLVKENVSGGISVFTSDSSAQSGFVATDVAVYKTGVKTEEIGKYGQGIELHKNVSAVLKDILLKENSGHGLFLINTKAIEIYFAVLEKNRITGIFGATVDDAETIDLTMSNLIIKENLPEELTNLFGRGIEMQNNISATAKNILLEKNHDAGIFLGTRISDPPLMNFNSENLIIRNTLPSQKDKAWGDGMVIQDNIKAEIKNALIEKNREAGILLTGDKKETSPNVKFDSLVISDTLVRACFEEGTDCGYAPDAAFGYGLSVQGGERSTVAYLTDVEINNNSTGIQIKGGIVLTTGECSLPFYESEKTACIHSHPIDC